MEFMQEKCEEVKEMYESKKNKDKKIDKPNYQMVVILMKILETVQQDIGIILETAREGGFAIKWGFEDTFDGEGMGPIIEVEKSGNEWSRSVTSDAYTYSPYNNQQSHRQLITERSAQKSQSSSVN